MAETPPSFPGGRQGLVTYLVENMKYPKAAAANNIEGQVLVSFVVEADGSLTHLKIVRPVDPDLEAEALRIVRNMPTWQPALDDNGKPFAYPVKLPVNFSLK